MSEQKLSNACGCPIRRPVAAIAVFFTVALGGCTKPESAERPSVATADSVRAVASADAPPVSKLPRDVDPSSLTKLLRCGGPQHKDACRILEEFGAATRWQPRIPSGHGSWFGRSFAVEHGADKSPSGSREKGELVMLFVRQVPTGPLSAGELPVHAALGILPPERQAAGVRLAGALSRGDTAPRNNDALAFVRAWTSGPEAACVPTEGASVRTVTERETYVREAPGQKVLVVQPLGNGDGAYAELWPVSW